VEYKLEHCGCVLTSTEEGKVARVENCVIHRKSINFQVREDIEAILAKIKKKH
jgi:hypothetical protein